ncbi:MAG: hypothetical protein QGG14_02840 [Planctomycetota bacterium]|jgi:hypothetical protein|nr:hypothetical protein [Planctomycetota bacterium]
MIVTLLHGAKCTPDRGSQVDIDSGAFLDWLADTDKCPSVECADDAAKLAGDGFVFAQYREGATSKSLGSLAESSATDLLCFDVDDIDLHALKAALPAWSKTDAVVYSTWKHTPEAPRVRLVVRLSRPVSNADDREFRQVYSAVAYLLHVPYDPQAADRARFFFVPQHKPGALGTAERVRFGGEALDVDALLRVKAGQPTAPVRPGGDFEAPLARPRESQVRALAKRLSSGGAGGDPRLQKIGASLDAALRGEAFAGAGSVHTAMVELAFEAVRAFPRLDADWFAGAYLEKSWSGMWPGEDVGAAIADWRKCVSTAESKLASGRAERVQEAALYAPEVLSPLDAEALARAAAMAGGLVCEHRGAYYVYDVRGGEGYVGPLKGTGLPAALRRCLVGVPGFSYQTPRPNAPPVLKSGPKLVEEYGVDLEGVHYHAVPPDGGAFDVERRLAHLPAYRWNEWPAVWHPIADELLRAMMGIQYGRVEVWLSKFRDLGQPLPALTLVGSRGTWKSRLSQTLSRFWGPPESPTPCDASQVLNRFSGPLLVNPVVWSDEQLARSDTGKAIPEAYRRSITERAHAVERKGLDPVTLHTATRHLISVNDVDKVFGGEVDAASVEATIERFLIVQVDGDAVGAFEGRWAGRPELARLRSGESLLEHVRWLEEGVQSVSRGRLWVGTDTHAEVLLRARFADDTLSLCMLIAVQALLAETSASVQGQLGRLPLVCDDDGALRLSPARIVDLWPDSRLTAGSGLRKPTTQRVGRMLQKAGFKADGGERAIDSRKWKAWKLEHERLREFLHAEGSYDWSDVASACETVFGRRPS